MSITRLARTGKEIYGMLQFGFYTTRHRALLKCTDYDYEWARNLGLAVASHEALVRVENSLTEIRDGQVYMASIAKVNLRTGSVAFAKGEEGEEGFNWDRYSKANIIITED